MDTSTSAEGAVQAPPQSVSQDPMPLTRGNPSRKTSARWIASAPLVGRDAVFAALQDPERIAALIRGEAGIGKSRILSELRRAASSDTFFVGCMHAATDVSHEPLIALVRTLHQGRRVSTEIKYNVMHAREADRLWYLHDAFAMAASAGPLVLQIDDLHLADKKSLEALHYCVGRLQDLPIRWQFATRPGNADVLELLLSLERAGLLSVVELDGLEPDALRLLAGSLRPEIAFDSAKVNELYRLTGGNPLYAELLLTAKNWNPRTPHGDLRRALQQRFAGLSRQALTIAGWLAVQGGPLSETSLASLAHLSTAQLQIGLGELSDNRVISMSEDQVMFRHELLSGTCYKLLTEKDRAARHLALSKTVENLWQRASHLEGARQFAQAAALFNEIAWQSLERHAPAEALNAFQRALQRMRAESATAFEARGGRAAALFRLGKIEEAKEAMQSFEDHASQLTPQTRVLVRRHYVEAAWDESNDQEHIRPILKRALQEARAVAKAALPGLLCVLGSMDERQGELQLARQSLEEGLQLCSDRSHQREKIRLLAWLGVVTARLGDLKNGIALLERAVRSASSDGLSNELAQCSTKLCYVSHMAGDLDRFAHWCRVGLDINGPKSKTTEALLKSNLASVAIDRGNLREALGFALSAETHIAASNLVLRCRILTAQAQIYAMLGDFEIADTALWSCAQLDLPPSSRRLCDFTSGFVLELRENYEQALKCYEATICGLDVADIKDVYEMRALAGIVRTACALKRPERARSAIDTLERVAKNGWPSSELSLSEAKGFLALLNGECSAARSELLAASARQYPFWSAYLELSAAVAGVDRTLFLEAIDKFDAMGAAFASDRARALARGHGFRPGRKREGHGVLSAREMSVAFFVANGKTNAEIGELLHVSSRTVEYHIGNILSKCGLRSRVEIAAKIAAGGSLDPAV